MAVLSSESEDDVEDTIIQNAVYCPRCNRYLVSTSVHKFVSCAHAMVDGGHDYLRKSPCQLEYDFSLFKSTSSDNIRAKLLVRFPQDAPGQYVLMQLLAYSQLRALVHSNLNATQRKYATFFLRQLEQQLEQQSSHYCSRLQCYQKVSGGQLWCTMCTL